MTETHAPSSRKAPANQPVVVLGQTEQSFVPYDENLLERARTQWQFGDWESLAKIGRETLQHHPDRAKIALLAGAGWLQTDNAAEAKQFIRLAQDWGISKKLLTQILVSGVHNSLGRAAAVAGSQPRALKHFESAIVVGTPYSDAKLLTQARTGEQLHQLGLPTPAGFIKVGAIEANSRGTGETALAVQLRKQADQFVSLRKNLSANLKTEVANATRQIGDFISLQNYFRTGQHSGIMLETNGWAVSSDFMLYLVKLIDMNDYDLIIEFGSGSSTLAIAKTLANLAPSRKDKPPVCFASFDHLKQFYQQTQALLEHAGLGDFVQLHLAPLADYTAPNGNHYPYYNCQTILAALAQKHAKKPLRLLVCVDGPPGSTAKHARYPAGPMLISCFKGANIDLLMDDAARTDEKEIISLWKNDIVQSGLSATETQIKLEKGACLIKIEGQTPN